MRSPFLVFFLFFVFIFFRLYVLPSVVWFPWRHSFHQQRNKHPASALDKAKWNTGLHNKTFQTWVTVVWLYCHKCIARQISVYLIKNLLSLQLEEIVSLMTDEFKLIDWRRFLLSAALPWPFPSLTQLLEVLQRFRTADADGTGYINQEQYLQVSAS